MTHDPRSDDPETTIASSGQNDETPGRTESTSPTAIGDGDEGTAVTDRSSPGDSPRNRAATDASPTGGSTQSRAQSDGDPSGPSRRSVLQGIGATVAATGVSTEGLHARDRGITTTAGSDVAGSAARRQSGVDPIPDSYTVEVNGVTHEVPINRKVVTGTCEDFMNFLSGMGIVPPQLSRESLDVRPLGITYGQWTINGTEVWPIAAPVVERVDPDLLSENLENPDAAVPLLDAPVGGALEIEERTVDGQDVLQVVGNDVSFGADVEVNVVDWHPSYPLSDSCLDFWCRIINQTVPHERIHAIDALGVAVLVNQKLDGTLDPPEDSYDLPDDGVPELPLSVAYGPDSRSRAAAERRLRERFRRLLYYYVTEATHRFFDRGSEFHDQEVDDEAHGACHDHCQSCGDTDQPPLGSFERWRMDVSYVLDVELTPPEDAPESGYSQLRRTYNGSFELTRTSGGPFDGVSSTIRGIASWLNGIDEFLDDLLGLVGMDVDLIPDDAAARTQGNYEGSGEVTVSNVKERYIEDSTGSGYGSRTTAFGTVPSSGTATLGVTGDVNEYTFGIPGPAPITGRRREFDSSGNVTEESVRVTVGTPMRALFEVSGGDVDLPDGSGVGDGAPGGANGTDGAVPDVGDVPNAGPRSMTFPIDDCERLLSGSVSNDLWGQFPNVQRALLRQEGEGPPDGQEHLHWQIIPTEFPEDPGHLTCPE